MKICPTVCEKQPGARRFIACLALLILCHASVRNVCANSKAEEYAVKAAFLYHFAQFVEWPQETFKSESEPLTYCTIGDDPFRGGLDTTLSGKMIGTRPIRVLHFKRPQEMHGCQVAFIGAAERKVVLAALTSLDGNPVLTVGEIEHFAQDGGMIGFSIEENKIRFEINLEAAEQAGLKISSQLLALAKTVYGAPKRG